MALIMVQAVTAFFTGFFKSLLSKRDYKLGWNIEDPDGNVYSISFWAYRVMENYKRKYHVNFYHEVEPLPNNRIFHMEWYDFAFFTMILNWFAHRGIDPEASFEDLVELNGGYVDQRYQDWMKENLKIPLGLFVTECIATTGTEKYIKPMVDNFFVDNGNMIPDDELETSTELEGSVHKLVNKPFFWPFVVLIGIFLIRKLKF